MGISGREGALNESGPTLSRTTLLPVFPSLSSPATVALPSAHHSIPA